MWKQELCEWLLMEWLRLILISLFTGLSLGLGFWAAYFGLRRWLK